MVIFSSTGIYARSDRESDMLHYTDKPVAGPEFSQGRCANSQIGIKFFAETCMKMKEFGSLGGHQGCVSPYIRQYKLKI